jgi:transposase-like protein
LTDQLLFYRREDLTASVRLKIATIALFFQLHGTITQLSKRYDISRQFVYDLRNALRDRLSGLFEPKSEDGTAEQDKRSLLRWILYLRLVGQCSLQAISCLLQALDLGRASPAYISEQLSQIGTKLGQRLSMKEKRSFYAMRFFALIRFWSVWNLKVWPF